jgi:hypothetical protein
MPSPFEVHTSLTALDPLRYVAVIPDGWQQGRGAFGGLVLAVLLRAMMRGEPDARRAVRSLSGDVCAPVLPGPAAVEVTVLRRGRALTNLDARMVRDGEVLARASAVLSEPRPFHLDATPDAPPAPRDWRAIEPAPVGPPVAPVFTQHYAFRNLGALPFSGHARAETEGFIAPRVAPEALDAPAVVGLLDAWWPAVFAACDGPRAAVTTSFTAQFLADAAALDPRAPLRYRARAVAASEGFSVEFRELWSGDALVALNQQTFAMLG